MAKSSIRRGSKLTEIREYPLLAIISPLLVVIIAYSLSFSASTCTNGSSCTISSANSSQQCYSSSSSVSHETAIDIQGVYDGATINAKEGTTEVLQTTTESCVTSTWTNGCSWTDGGCHFVCSQQQMAGFSGYKRYRCNFHAQPRKAKYDRTICMQDLDVVIPRESLSPLPFKPLEQISSSPNPESLMQEQRKSQTSNVGETPHPAT